MDYGSIAIQRYKKSCKKLMQHLDANSEEIQFWRGECSALHRILMDFGLPQVQLLEISKQIAAEYKK